MSRYACPECHAPVSAPRGHRDGRCLECRRVLAKAKAARKAARAEARAEQNAARRAA